MMAKHGQDLKTTVYEDHQMRFAMTQSDQTESLTTHSGLTLAVRPVRKDDGERLRAFFANVATDDLRYRFLSGINEVSSDQIAAMVDVDHKQTEDFLAFVDGDTLVATALIATDPAGERSEVAIVVRADHKHKGIGWTMLNHAAAYAKARGVKSLESVESRQNKSAIEVERDSGFDVKPYPGDSTLVIVSKQLA
tara:strand:+ start:2380 stop:2961 length:582 start_codon:yes stop_codon:yes gene_type:complete